MSCSSLRETSFAKNLTATVFKNDDFKIPLLSTKKMDHLLGAPWVAFSNPIATCAKDKIHNYLLHLSFEVAVHSCGNSSKYYKYFRYSSHLGYGMSATSGINTTSML